ncbi:unnamed protein product, partial [marine sediment metagenome]
MKKLLIAVVAVALMLGVAGIAWAGDSDSGNINARVIMHELVSLGITSNVQFDVYAADFISEYKTNYAGDTRLFISSIAPWTLTSNVAKTVSMWTDEDFVENQAHGIHVRGLAIGGLDVWRDALGARTLAWGPSTVGAGGLVELQARYRLDLDDFDARDNPDTYDFTVTYTVSTP